MSTVSTTPKRCTQCVVNSLLTCNGCNQTFCIKHQTEHRQNIDQRIDFINEQNEMLRQEVSRRSIDKLLVEKINEWEQQSIKNIQSTATEARTELIRLLKESKDQLMNVMHKLSTEINSNRIKAQYIEDNLTQWEKQIVALKNDMESSFKFELVQEDGPRTVRSIKIKSTEKTRTSQNNPMAQIENRSANNSSQVVPIHVSPSNGVIASNKPESLIPANKNSSESSLYPCLTFGSNQSSVQDIQNLFEHLMLLEPMNKHGPMSGKCGPQTHQMEQFLAKTFGFKNQPGEYIVQGVKSFKLHNRPDTLDPNTVIRFPTDIANAFSMSVKEIMNWQRSYKVYSGNFIQGLDKEFLQRALEGHSKDGREAFRMKFVVRISTCPILMEFDAKVISRNLEEDWPNRIKLVSVTGIDFAGRKHDVADILYYVTNWKDVFEIDPTKDEPALLNARDFRLKKAGEKGELRESRILEDLTHMARLRLQACDEEGVEIVVETGIGLGVFAGEHIGVDEKVRTTSAIAIRAVLEQHGSTYKNIRAVVFALPIIDTEKTNRRARDSFSVFAENFQEPPYNGPIPVLIADQDMHRLTVAIARRGFKVSELNPADSHGVFGEYWQNQGPAVEEKLALTTVGLLVQHHLINPHVLDTNNYYFI
ncbi:unnamed protein product [Rotaria magnacalcarata]|uniref:Uncharacterized protein n=5 Tax=Rotaria magnacalcarata TaxID=392030 RepID=A0A819U5D9_9BILA|nr:unnamed protein product [Rotaria magnacalcarata]CAF4088780.1 unnamed protein product [Rotaria magnacalcarata]